MIYDNEQCLMMKNEENERIKHRKLQIEELKSTNAINTTDKIHKNVRFSMKFIVYL